MSRADRIQGVRGMNDVLPADEPVWSRFEDTVAAAMRAYGYQRIRTPIVEHTRLFVRGIGEVTDIVEKEMYSFTDALNGEQLTLRPEGTAGVVRSVIEHNLLHDGPRRLWYAGPMFRHERPQKGRYRQFHQVGLEALGLPGPDADAEVILLCHRLWSDLGLQGVELQLNTLGQPEERRAHREALIAHFEAHAHLLDEDARRRLHSNPLRILDTKNPAMQPVADSAPRLIDFLGPESLAHLEGVQALLRARGIAWRVNPRLVRDLDYYNLTVFEWVCDGLTICGGGRYDPLVAMLGGKPAPGCGFGIGVERVLDLMRSQSPQSAAALCDAYVVHQGEGVLAAAFEAAEQLRDVGLDVLLHAGGGGFKAQFRRADASGAFVAVVLGEDEVRAGEVTVKWLRGDGGQPGAAPQQRVSMAGLAELLLGALAGDGDGDVDDDNA
jgi:histidyl-tRNA synthetase